MGSSQSDICAERGEVVQLEAVVLTLTGLSFSEIKVYDLEIWPGCTIHTIEVGLSSKPKLLFVHGYGGTAAAYYRLIRPLSEHYHCYFVDIVGMGLSSRVAYECKTTQECLDFFVGFIESFRVKTQLESFYLVAHSLGGYLSAQYASRYPQYIKKLFLISPIGFVQKPENFELRRIEI